MSTLARSTLALAVLCGACGAHAGSSASGTLDGFTVTLVDLDPDDGIAPSISFVDGASRASGVVFQPFGVFDDDVAVGGSAWGDAAASVALSLGRASATLQGAAPDGSGAVMQVSGQAAEPGGPSGSLVQYQAQVWAPYASAGAFVLSPHTALTISADASLSTTTQSSGSGRDFATVGAYLFLQGTADVLTFSCESATGTQCSDARTRRLSVSFANEAGTALDGSFQAWTQVAGFSQAVAVPEPASALLLAGGLCVVGRGLRHRARREAGQV